jgi:hypothetical protein
VREAKAALLAAARLVPTNKAIRAELQAVQDALSSTEMSSAGERQMAQGLAKMF